VADPRPTRVGVGLIGAGSAARAYLRTLDSLVGSGHAWAGPVCARNPATWPAFRSTRPDARLVTTPEEVFESGIDLVVITTAPDSHADLARRALQRGINVVVEKPLTLDPQEARALVAVAAETAHHLVVAPFVQMSSAFRLLWTWVTEGVIGSVHSARSMYGNSGSDWASWYHTSDVGPLGDLAPYNIKSLSALLGPVREVRALHTSSGLPRAVDGVPLTHVDPDTVHLLLRHRGGAISSVLASHAVRAYRRTAIELYGSEGTANLLGDDWDPAGIEVFRPEWNYWRSYPSPDPTWNWTDGLRATVTSLATGTPIRADLDHDVHVIDVLHACVLSAADDGRPINVASDFEALDLSIEYDPAAVIHDHTRPPDEQ
jgi:predicted dehydrogenase